MVRGTFSCVIFYIAAKGVIWQASAPFDGGNHPTKRNVETTEVVGSIEARHLGHPTPGTGGGFAKNGIWTMGG